jgi:WhiB family redox-sensing transcriptional regulator
VNWRDRALCAQVDPDLWFPEKGCSPRPAVRICQDCPVRAECLSYALAHHEWWGVWGGLTYRERLDLSAAEPGRVAA